MKLFPPSKNQRFQVAAFLALAAFSIPTFIGIAFVIAKLIRGYLGC